MRRQFRVLALFNDALGGSFAPGQRPASDERLQRASETRQLGHVPMLDGYRSGDPLEPSTLGYLDLEAETPEAAAEQLFRLLNEDARPNGKVERSLSVGDIALVENPNGERYLFGFEMLGVRELAADEALSVERQL